MICVVVVGASQASATATGTAGRRSSLAPATSTVDATLDGFARSIPTSRAIVFEDFAFRLFSTAQRARANAEALAAVAPYVSSTARNRARARATAGPVQQVVIGSLRVADIAVPERPTR